MKKLIGFIENVNKEMTKVRWATKKEMVTYSVATLVFILIFAFFFSATDIILATVKTWVN